MPLPSYANPLFSLHFPKKQALHPALRHLPPAHLPLPFRTSHVRPATGPPRISVPFPRPLPRPVPLPRFAPRLPAGDSPSARPAHANPHPSFPYVAPDSPGGCAGCGPPCVPCFLPLPSCANCLFYSVFFPFPRKQSPRPAPHISAPFPRPLSRVPLPPCAVARQPLFPLCSSRFPPAHASSPRFQPASGPPLFRHSLSRSPGPGIRLPP